MTLTPEERAYYVSHSAMSDPGELAPLLDALPAAPAALADAVSGLILHPVFVARRGVACPPESADDAESRSVRAILTRVLSRDSRPLGVARVYERRFVGTCRDYALLACSVLQRRGVPSRLRVGFATYFVPGFHEDHWLCEYWDAGGWRLLDAELDGEARTAYAIDFASWDVPRDRFLTAAEAWQALRGGRLDPMRCGVSFVGIAGAWFVAGSVVRDLAALNKREMLPWDYWGIARDLSPATAPSESVAASLDALAALIAGPTPDWTALRAAYEGADSLRVPPVVMSFPKGVPTKVTVPA
jgi:hypothetical protein